mgnify:CR=1 FL=1
MRPRRYQPERTDLLINTDWGTSLDELSPAAAREQGLKRFHGRWVTTAEKRQLREEYSTYQSIRILGCLFIFLTFPIVPHMADIAEKGLLATALAVICALALLAAGIGLYQFKIFGRNMALVGFCAFLILPFTPFMSDEKGAPLMILLGIGGLYYLLRRTARKIFAPPDLKKEGSRPRSTPAIRKLIYWLPLLLVFYALYTLYGLHQGRQMAAAVCAQAAEGMALEQFLATLPAENYTIIAGPEVTLIVPKKGMARSQCAVFHDGTKITGANTATND